MDINLNSLEKRLAKSLNRPLLKNVDLKKKIKELDTARRKYYLLADIRIYNIDTIFNTCQNIIEKFFSFHEKTNSNKNY